MAKKDKAVQSYVNLSASTQTEQIKASEGYHGLHHQLPGLFNRIVDILLQNSLLYGGVLPFARKQDQDAFEGITKSSGPRELFSLSDTTRCKGKPSHAVHWVAGRTNEGNGFLCLLAMTVQASVKSVSLKLQDLLAACYTELPRLPTRPGDAEHALLFWDLKELTQPESVFLSCNGILCFEINPAQEDLIVAGCCGGSVVLWDRKAIQDDQASTHGMSIKGPMWPTQQSALNSNHGLGIAAIKWLPGASITGSKLILNDDSKLCSVFVCLAPEGKLVFWDTTAITPKKHLRDTSTEDGKELRPAMTMKLEVPAHSMHVHHGSTGLQLLLGCSDGRLVSLTEKTLQSPRMLEGEACSPLNQLHCGAVVCITPSPLLGDLYLSVGDWTFSIFDIDQPTEALMVSAPAPAPYTAGCWSPSRPGVIMLTRQDGILEIWDLVEATHQASVEEVIAPCALTCLACSPPLSKPLLAAGDEAGILHILDVQRRLSKSFPNEAETLLSILRSGERV